MHFRTYIIIFGIVAIVVFGVAALFITYYSPKTETLSDARLVGLPGAPVPRDPGFIIARKDKGSVVFHWENLPAGAIAVDIYRAKLKGGAWQKWKRVETSGSVSGSVEIEVADGSDPNAYKYYFEAVSGSGTTLWNTSSTPSAVATSTKPTGVSGGSGGGGTPTSTGSQPNPTSTIPEATPTSTANATGTPNATSTPLATSTGTGGTPTSTIFVRTDPFWVDHVNQKIEIGWQNLPSSTVSVIVSRSESSNGPWTKLLEQNGPFSGAPYSIRLLDETIYSPRYYRLRAFSASDALIETLGPLFLDALPQ